MKFYGREKQKKQLHQLFQSDCQKIALIYGRRRIGKSELIRQCLRETKVKSIYYECKQTTEWNNNYYDDPVQGKNGEFDIVTKDDRGYIFYEAKFKKDPITNKIIENEIEQVQRTGLLCCKYGFFSKSGFACANHKDCIFIDLKELYLQ